MKIALIEHFAMSESMLIYLFFQIPHFSSGQIVSKKFCPMIRLQSYIIFNEIYLRCKLFLDLLLHLHNDSWGKKIRINVM